MTQPGEVRIRRAVLSVSDKTGIVDFAKGLAELGVELVSTGGTAQALEAAGLEVLAGYMQLLDAHFLGRFPQRVINVHPALLPAFPGIGSVEQALAYGVKTFGVTVHFVDEGVDTGPIILQRALDLPRATEASEVRAALRPIEHELLCEAVRLIARDAVRLDPANPRRVLIAS